MFPDSAGHGMLIATLIFIVQDLSSLGGAQAWTYNYSTSPNRRWPEASQWCRQHFTAMASMQNQEESNFLNDLLPFTSKYYWIGVRKEGEAWLRDGTDQKVPEDAQDWAPEEPDSIEGQDCVEVYIKRDKDTAKWNNENCRKKKGTVCYSISCRPDSCSEHADCVETVGGHSCQCHPGFQGPRCETAVSCEQSLDVERGSHYCSHPYGSNRFNSSCLFHCERGFLLAGASALLCQANGRWDRPVPLCQAVQCPVLDQRNISAGSLNCSHPIAPHSYNSTCEARCDAGYEPSGQEQIWCDHSGRWTASVLTCRVKKCSTVSFPVTGNMTCLDAIEPFAFGSRCNFTCKEGFNLRGETSLSCLATGEWSSPPPTCTAQPCPLLAKAPKHGRMNCSNPHSPFSFASRCEFECSEGFLLRGTQATVCNSLGLWSDDAPTCQPVRCEPIRALSSRLSMTCSHPLGNFSFGSECRFACQEGFSLNGSKLLLCPSAGSWSGSLPVCTEEAMPLGTAMVMYTLVGGASAALLLALLGLSLLFATRFRKRGDTMIPEESLWGHRDNPAFEF